MSGHARKGVARLDGNPIECRRWFVLRPELYEPKLAMYTDGEILLEHVHWASDDEQASLDSRIQSARPGDWFPVRYGIAICLRAEPVLGPDQVFE